MLDFYRFFEHFIGKRMEELFTKDRRAWRELPYISRQLFHAARASDPRLHRLPVFELSLEKQRNDDEFADDAAALLAREELVGRNRARRERQKLEAVVRSLIERAMRSLRLNERIAEGELRLKKLVS